MLYCPGKGQELLSALGVNLECHASSVFLVLKPPLSIIDALSKSIAWLLLISIQPQKNSYLELVPILLVEKVDKCPAVHLKFSPLSAI